MKTKSRVLLIDAHNQVYRMHHAFSKTGLKAPDGSPTGALYGVHTLLKKLSGYDYVALVFDPKGKTHRHKLDATYKGNRSEQPDEVQTQLPLVRELGLLYGFQCIVMKGYEADDVIASIASQVKGKVSILTGDKDYIQLMSDRITIVHPKTGPLTEASVIERWGVKPSQFADYLALVGDTTDNFIGVRGVGEKGATAMLTEYGTLLQAIYKHKLFKGNKAKKKEALLGIEMATMKRDLVVPELVPLQQESSNLKKFLRNHGIGLKSKAKVVVSKPRKTLFS